MADESSELVGGIGVELTAGHKGVERGIDQANTLLEQWTKQRPTVQLQAEFTGTGGGGGGSQQIRFGKGSLGGASGAEYQNLERAIASAMGKEEKAATQTVAALRNVQEQAATTRASVSDIGASVQPVEISVDRASLQAELNAALNDIKTFKAEAEQLLSVTPKVATTGSRARGTTAQQQAAATYLNANPPQRTSGAQSVTIYDPARDARTGAPPARGSGLSSTQQQRIRQAYERHAQQVVQDISVAATAGTQVAAQRGEASSAVIRRRASILAGAGRAQTAVAGATGLFFGSGRERIEAEDAYTTAVRRQNIAIRDLAKLDKDKASTAADYVPIQRELTAATQDRADAEARLSKLSTGPAVLKNIATLAVGGAAFALAMKAVDFALATAVPAIGEWIDLQSGFQSKSTAVTGALAKQTSAMSGNVDAALAQADVNARLSASTATYLDQQLKLTAQVKAGALAQSQTSELFRASLGTNQNTPQGLYGGFGGVGGGGLLGEQLGGGKGFVEQIADDFDAFKQQLNKIENPSQSLSFQPGNAGIAGGGIPLDFGAIFGQNEPPKAVLPFQRDQETKRVADERIRYETDLNDSAKRGAAYLNLAADAVAHFGTITAEQAKQIEASPLDNELKELAKSGKALFDSNGELILSTSRATKALEVFSIGKGLNDPGTLSNQAVAQEKTRQLLSQSSVAALKLQQAFARPAALGSIDRQGQYALVQQQRQQALQNLASPLQPVGTGIAAANSKEQDRISKGQERSVELQKELNQGYALGRQYLEDAANVIQQNFGQAQAADFRNTISQIGSIGREIASVQAGIRNEQAAYQVAQYNVQLKIARRTLADIGGLTGQNFGAGQSYLGVLERQNLALSRQGQLLAFALQQRQINFQVALAGFQAPGVTPEERQANVKEAEIEASFAQKQLNIQKQLFGNQVQIVDIQNLRQGADLAAQIGLLLQGRQVTIDTAQAQERLALLQERQQQLVAKAGTYLQKVDNVAALAMGEIAQLEAAAGKALYQGAQDAIYAIYGFYKQFLNILSGAQGTGSGTGNEPGHIKAAGGAHFSTTGTTNITAGEAGDEEVVVLSNPKALSSGALGLGGGMVFAPTVIIDKPSIRDSNDVDRMAIEVSKVLGRQASALGLRTIG